MGENGKFVLVTGASGFIASHVVKQLQEEGYQVRGTVRDLNNEERVKNLKELCPEAKYNLELVEADLLNADVWEQAVKDCVYVVHIASPFPVQQNLPADKEDEIIKPAVDGTLNVLKACKEAKTVKRVVLTSSSAAIMSDSANDPEKKFTEEDWADAEKAETYTKSKILAEKAAWDYVKELPDEEKFELVVLNPAFVMGPVLNGSQCTSAFIIKRLLERSMPAVPRLNFPVVDVRDVAAAHVKAVTSSEAIGNRHILYGESVWMKDMAAALAKEFRPQGYNVPTANCPYFAMWLYSLFDRNLKQMLPRVGKEVKLDNTRMKEVFKIEDREINSTFIDMAYSLIESGIVKKPKPKKQKPVKEDKSNGEAKKEEKEDAEKVEEVATAATEEAGDKSAPTASAEDIKEECKEEKTDVVKSEVAVEENKVETKTEVRTVVEKTVVTVTEQTVEVQSDGNMESKVEKMIEEKVESSVEKLTDEQKEEEGEQKEEGEKEEKVEEKNEETGGE